MNQRAISCSGREGGAFRVPGREAMNAKPLPLLFSSCEDCGGRKGGGRAVYGSLVVINSFALLNDRGREGFRRFNCFAIRASELPR